MKFYFSFLIYIVVCEEKIINTPIKNNLYRILYFLLVKMQTANRGTTPEWGGPGAVCGRRGRRKTVVGRADQCLAAGDVEGEAVWLRIVKAIEELLSKERPDDAEVH